MFRIWLTAYNIIMPKYTPTQFYNIANENGMKLRSGKLINCMKTSQLGKETVDLLTIYGKCDEASTLARGAWANIINDAYWVSFCAHGDEKFQKLLDKVVGGHFSTQCTRLYAFENYLRRNRTTINRYNEKNKIKGLLRDVMCQKIKESIKKLDDMRVGGHERLCGCSDRQRAEEEELMIQMCFDLELGPGHFARNQNGARQWVSDAPWVTIQEFQRNLARQWVSTPDVSIEEFRRNIDFEKLRWRHDLQRLRNRFENHLAYFQRVPHHSYREAFLALASCKINEDTARNVLSFLHV